MELWSLLPGTPANNVRPALMRRAAAGAHAISAWISTARQKNRCDGTRVFSGISPANNVRPALMRRAAAGPGRLFASDMAREAKEWQNCA